MNHEELEYILRRTPFKRPPREWRDAILGAADACRHEPQPGPVVQRSSPQTEPLVSSWKRRIRALLWPHPIAWGGIAAAWIGIVSLNASSANVRPATPSQITGFLPWQTVFLADEEWSVEPSKAPTPNNTRAIRGETAPRSALRPDWRTI